MRRPIIVMFCSFFCFMSAPAAADMAPQAPPNRGALFKVTDAGHTLYLFGTIHVGAIDFYPLEPRVSAALEGASTLALEIDPLGDQAAVLEAVRQYGLYPARDGSAAAAIKPEFKPRLERLLKQYGIAPESVARMKPWLLANVLAISEFSAQGFETSLAVDLYLSQQARARHIPVLELESVGAQIALFGRMTVAEQSLFLEEGIVAIENQTQAAQVKELALAWSTADAAGFDALAKQAAEDDSFSGKFVQKVLLDERNPGLADGIARLLAREKNSMAAIGILHEVGTGSVPALLRQRGLCVQRLY